MSRVSKRNNDVIVQFVVGKLQGPHHSALQAAPPKRAADAVDLYDAGSFRSEIPLRVLF